MSEQMVAEIEKLKRRVADLERIELGGLWKPVYDTTLAAPGNFDWNPVASGYSRLLIWLLGRGSDGAAAFARVSMYLNGDTTITNYYSRDNDAGAIENNPTVGFVTSAGADSNAWGFIQIMIPAYSVAIRQVASTVQSNPPTTANLDVGLYAWRWQTAAAITRIQINISAAIFTFVAGSRLTVFAS